MIYQVYFNEESKSKLDKGFTPYNNSSPVRDKEFEYGVMRDVYFNHDPFSKEKYLGVLSWKFKEKTGLTSRDIKSWINKNRGYDVYIINPFPELSYLYFNIWYQGEYCHPGLIDLTEELFNKAELDINIKLKRHDNSICSFCNYWVGNQKFYKVYMDYCEKLYKAIYSSDDRIKKLLFSTNVYGGNTDASFFPFIFERMLSTVLANNNFKVLVYDNLSFRMKAYITKVFVIKASDYLKKKNTFDEYDIEYINSFGQQYNDMLMRKFTSYENYKCGKVIT